MSMTDLTREPPWHRKIFVVSPEAPLPELDVEAATLAEAGLWRCAYFHPTLKNWRLRGWRGLPVPETDHREAYELIRPGRGEVMPGEALALHPVFHDRYVRLWELEREVLQARISALCALARRQGATNVVLRRVIDPGGKEQPRFVPLREATELGLPVEDPRFLLGAGAPLPLFHQPLSSFDKEKLFLFIRRSPELQTLERACRAHSGARLSLCLEQQPFLPRFDELSLALAKLGCRPFDTRRFPPWKLAQNVTWCFDLEFDGGVQA
jgi:hypothetical protein